MRSALLAVALLLAIPAAGQGTTQAELCRPPVLSLEQAPPSFEPGGAWTLLFAIENSNGAPVDSVRATVTTTAPAGWTATVAQRDLTLGPRNHSVGALAIIAPSRGAGVASGNITLHVTFVCTSGEIQTTASASQVVEVRIRSFEAPWPVVVGAFAVLAVGVGILGVRRLRRGIAIAPAMSDKDVAPGKSVKFTFVVENRRGRPQRLRLVSVGVPEGWSLHLALDEVDLEPGEEKTLWAILKAPPQTPEGTQAAIVLRLLAAGDREVASATLRARVASGES